MFKIFVKKELLAPFFMLELFIQYLSFEKRYSPHTIGAYEHDLNQFISFADIKTIQDFQEVNSFLVRGWIVQLIDDRISNRSVNRKLASLRTYFRWLRKEGIIQVNPMAKIQGPRNEKRLPVFIKESELTGFFVGGCIIFLAITFRFNKVMKYSLYNIP